MVLRVAVLVVLMLALAIPASAPQVSEAVAEEPRPTFAIASFSISRAEIHLNTRPPYLPYQLVLTGTIQDGSTHMVKILIDSIQ